MRPDSRLEEWILLAHKLKEIIKVKDKEIHLEKYNVKDTLKKWNKDIEVQQMQFDRQEAVHLK